MEKPALVQSFCCHWHEVTQTSAMVDYEGEVTAKKACQYDEYGSFEYLLFLFLDISENIGTTRLYHYCS